MGRVFPQADKIFLKSKDCISYPYANRREEAVISGLHSGHCVTMMYFFTEGRGATCIVCDEVLNKTYAAFLF